MANINESETDVIICGCGPTGAMLSVLLSQHSVPHVILEREDDVTVDPRGIALDEDGIRCLQACGIYNKIFTDIGQCSFSLQYDVASSLMFHRHGEIPICGWLCKGSKRQGLHGDELRDGTCKAQRRKNTETPNQVLDGGWYRPSRVRVPQATFHREAPSLQDRGAQNRRPAPWVPNDVDTRGRRLGLRTIC